MARLALGVSLLGGRIERERMAMTFPDHFSDHSDRYEAFRPTYPDALLTYLASLVPSHDLAWDCATGNGQAAFGMIPSAMKSRENSPLPLGQNRSDPSKDMHGVSLHRNSTRLMNWVASRCSWIWVSVFTISETSCVGWR